ncbi:MAG: hypothetical protein K6T66_06745 [Peptococcaceae bacterium]|nr:hypothetical protein [Peptococcaceae bacterium]
MKKAVAILLTLGILMVGAGVVNAATLNITANVQTVLTLVLDPTSMTFTDVQAGVASAPQTLTATTSGSGSYQLQLSSTTFTTAGGSQPASVLQYKETSAGTYVSASATPTNMLTVPGTATAGGDAKTFDVRVNFPAAASSGTYAATVTITASPL